MSNRTNTDRYWSIILLWCSLVVALTAIASAASKTFSPDQLIYLARSLSQGHLYVDDMPLIYPDYVVFNGHVYLPPGPFSALVLIPFLPLLDMGLQPAWVSFLFSVINVVLLYAVLRMITRKEDVRYWAILFFFGGTVYFGVSTAMISWYFAHILGTTLILFALILVLKGNRSTCLIGFVVGLAAATRLTYGFAMLFFIWYVLRSKKYSLGRSSWKSSLGNIFGMAVGFCVPLIFLMYYNYARFGDMLETGYGIVVVGSSNLEATRSQGLFSAIHIPRNLRFLLIQGPTIVNSLGGSGYKPPFIQPSPLGMSIFLTSPAIIWVFKNKLNTTLVQACWIGTLAMLVPILLYYATGWIQFGYRYSLDFLPFLILLAAKGFDTSKKNYWRFFIVLSVIINLWGTAWLHSWL